MSRLTRLLAGVAETAVLGLVLFASAGRLDLPWLWAYLAVSGVAVLGLLWAMAPELARERMRFKPGDRDKAGLAILGLSYGAHLILAGFDVGRTHGSDTVPAALQALGLVAYAAAFAWVCWAIVTNRFFYSVVSYRPERGHHLVTGGPYRFMRHPGYAGALLIGVASPLALGSWLALVPMMVYAAEILHRTFLEDRFLMAHLPGYPAYALAVPHRLWPRLTRGSAGRPTGPSRAH